MELDFSDPEPYPLQTLQQASHIKGRVRPQVIGSEYYSPGRERRQHVPTAQSLFTALPTLPHTPILSGRRHMTLAQVLL